MLDRKNRKIYFLLDFLEDSIIIYFKIKILREV